MTYRYEMDEINIGEVVTEQGGIRLTHIIGFERSDLISLAIGTLVVALVSAVVTASVYRAFGLQK